VILALASAGGGRIGSALVSAGRGRIGFVNGPISGAGADFRGVPTRPDRRATFPFDTGGPPYVATLVARSCRVTEQKVLGLPRRWVESRVPQHSTTAASEGPVPTAKRPPVLPRPSPPALFPDRPVIPAVAPAGGQRISPLDIVICGPGSGFTGGVPNRPDRLTGGVPNRPERRVTFPFDTGGPRTSPPSGDAAVESPNRRFSASSKVGREPRPAATRQLRRRRALTSRRFSGGRSRPEPEVRGPNDGLLQSSGMKAGFASSLRSERVFTYSGNTDGAGPR
jgi:hypothetical protein